MKKDFGYVIKGIETCLYGEKRLIYFCFEESDANKIVKILRDEEKSLNKKNPDEFIIQKVEIIDKDEIQGICVWVVDTGYANYDPIAVCPTEEKAIEFTTTLQKDPKAKQYHEIGVVPIWNEDNDKELFVFHWE